MFTIKKNSREFDKSEMFVHQLESKVDISDTDQEQVIQRAMLDMEECLQSPTLLILLE